MKNLSCVEFAKLAGVTHPRISRLAKEKRLFRVGGLFDVENPINKMYLMTRFVEVQVNAEMGKPSPGWVLVSVNDAGRKTPIATWTEIDYPKTIRLSRFKYYIINDDDEHATDKQTGRALPLVFERG